MMKKTLLALISAVVLTVVTSVVATGEPFHKVSLTELPFQFTAAMKSLEVDSAGNTIDVEGVVKEFSLDGKQIELEVDKLTKVGNDVFILTRSYGKVKVTFDSNARTTIWLTSSQTKKFKALRKSR
jgi:hypothetical protein